MAIPRRLLTALSKELDAYKLFASGSTTNSVLAWLDQVGAVASSDIPALRDVSIAVIEESMGMCQADVVSATLDAWDAATGANGLARAQAVSESMAGMAHEYADHKVRWLVGEVVDGRMTPIQFAKACGDMADRGVNHMHLAAMQAASDRQGGKERWARVPSGSETCPFCIMLAGRGFVYRSAETAGGHYHVHCDCRVVKGVKGKTHVEGYDPDAIERRWRACADTIGLDPADAFDESGNPTKEILAEVATRDPKWLGDGTEPPVTFASSELKNEIRRERPHEIRTAKRLTKNGVPADFVVDAKVATDEKTGQKKLVGLADFANGYEIKTLGGASSFNTIDGYLKQTSKKANATAIVFDNSENEALTDEALESFIKRSRRFSKGRIYMIGKDETLKRIK